MVDLVRRVRTRVEGREDYPRDIRGISEEIGVKIGREDVRTSRGRLRKFIPFFRTKTGRDA